ncbi:MFS transporter [Salicibibacter halophilus]|uniref:MFS transporter n=1 Tax=Salicibibacter halophilus TaxID=2502791 RepID=A0A514LK41_9BACI|nr:MFS transporter [Salicibibacter halophilus]QDI92228.1 MFS transporter [Salicibibacter halophilus]
MSYIQQGTKTYKFASLALFFAGLVTFATIYTVQPLLPIFANDFGVSASVASLAVSFTTGLLALCLLVAAPLSDRFGRKRVMVLSMFMTSLIGLFTAMSPDFMTLLFLRALLGVVVAGVPAIAMTYVVEEFDPKVLGKVMGLYIAGSSIGGMSGRLLAGLFTDLFDWRIALGSIGLLALILSILFIFFLPNPKNSAEHTLAPNEILRNYTDLFFNKRLIVLISLGFILMGGFIALYNYFAFVLMEPPYELSQSFIGAIYIVYLAGTFSSIYMGRKADVFGKPAVIQVSIAIMALGAVLTLGNPLAMKLIGIIIFTFGFFGAHSIASAWVTQKAGHHNAQASSLYLLAYYLGSSIAGTIGGFFWSSFHWGGVIVFVLVLIALAYPVVWYARKN